MNDSTCKAPGPAARNSSGFTYMALLAAIVIIGITMGSVAKSWQNVTQRDKEEELLFRGNQYRLAIERYYLALNRRQYPQSIDNLLKDDRTPADKRYLRQQYKDPVTGEDFVLIIDPATRRISGVRSSSDKAPIKQVGFPAELQDFEGKTHYSEWLFIYAPTKKQVFTSGTGTHP